MRVPDRGVGIGGSASLRAFGSRADDRRFCGRHLRAHQPVHDPGPERERCRRRARLPAAGGQRVAVATGSGPRPARVRPLVATARFRSDRDAGRLAADDRSGSARDDGRAHGPHLAGVVHRPESVPPRRRPDGDPQPGARQQRRIVPCVCVAGRRSRDLFRRLPGRVPLRQARPQSGRKAPARPFQRPGVPGLRSPRGPLDAGVEDLSRLPAPRVPGSAGCR